MLTICLLTISGCGVVAKQKPISKSDQKNQSSDANQIESKSIHWINENLDCKDDIDLYGKAIPVKAKLIEYQESYWWSEFTEDGSDIDGSSPYGEFVVIEPELRRGHHIGVMFTYDLCKYKPQQFIRENIDGVFTFTALDDFITSRKATVHNNLTGSWTRIQ